MPLNGVDPSAKQPGRIRRNWNRVTKGAVASTLGLVQPIAINGTNQIVLNVALTSGLTTSGSALSIKLDTTPGLVLASTGLKVLLDPTNPGLQLTTGLKVTVNAAGALTQTSTGLQVAVDNSTIAISGNQLIVKAGGIGAGQLGIVTTKGDLLGFTTTPVRVAVGGNGTVLTADSTQASGLRWATPAAGSVTSVAVVEGTLFTVIGNPVTSSGTITFTLNNAAANLVFAGPSSGAAANPAFRSLVVADLPGGNWVGTTNGHAALGSNFAITGADTVYQDTGLSVSLPAAGTYWIQARVRGLLNTSVAGGVITARLFDVTNSAAIPDTATLVVFTATAATSYIATASFGAIFVATGATTVRLEAFRNTGTTYTASSIATNSNGQTTLDYFRLK